MNAWRYEYVPYWEVEGERQPGEGRYDILWISNQELKDERMGCLKEM